jgi:hypothetical protein
VLGFRLSNIWQGAPASPFWFGQAWPGALAHRPIRPHQPSTPDKRSVPKYLRVAGRGLRILNLVIVLAGCGGPWRVPLNAPNICRSLIQTFGLTGLALDVQSTVWTGQG